VSSLGDVILEHGRYVFLMQKSDVLLVCHRHILTSGKYP
jgi:hypothetical protein